MSENKIKYGLKNVHVAKCTETIGENGEYTYSYGTPKRVHGAVNLNLDPEGESTTFYADDIVYYQGQANNGYSGSIEFAKVPNWFAEEYLREVVDANGIQAESAAVEEVVPFALLFEFAGDVKATRHVMYYCTASRMAVSGKTKEGSKEPQTETMNLMATPLKDETMLVKAKTTLAASTETYNAWYTTVQVADVELGDFQ